MAGEHQTGAGSHAEATSDCLIDSPGLRLAVRVGMGEGKQRQPPCWMFLGAFLARVAVMVGRVSCIFGKTACCINSVCTWWS